MIFFAIFPPIKAIGIYAIIMSQAMNHIGAGNIKLTAMPPSKNKAPIANENLTLCDAAIHPATMAPIKVPRACAKKGNMKYFALSVGITLAKAFVSFGSRPSMGIKV